MSSAPLDGILVVDLTRHLPGPLAARILRDLGARVVKVEEPEIGDPVRLAPPLRDGVGTLAAILLAGVESVALDLGRAPAREVLARLLERADVLLESFRPGRLARFGLAPEELAERFPRLVVCSISGWGQAGPHAHRAGHDLTYQALAGTLAATGRMPNAPVADLLGAWSAAAAVLAALVERRRSGRGARVDAALLDAAGHAALTALAVEGERPHAVGEPLPLTGALPCYNLYRTRDGGRVALAALEPRFWKRFCRAVGRRDLVGLQYDGAPESRRVVAALVAERDAAEWSRLFDEHDLPGEAVLSLAEAAEHPQVRERGLVMSSTSSTSSASSAPGGTTAGSGAEGAPLGFPALFDGERPRAGAGVPAVGADTDRVLEELGVDEARLSRRARRRLGIGPRLGWRRLLARWSRAGGTGG